MEAGQYPLSKVLISGGGRCNVMHDPMKGPNYIAKVMSIDDCRSLYHIWSLISGLPKRAAGANGSSQFKIWPF